MDPASGHLERELAGIRAELARLAERVYQLDHTIRSRPMKVDPPPAPAPVQRVDPAPKPPAPSQASTPVEPTDEHIADARREAFARLHARPMHPVKSQPPAQAVQPERAPKPTMPTASEAWSFERLIGAKAFAAAGALIVVLGAAFFLKLAIDQGWVRAIHPAVRCGGVAAFGGLLIALGELARKKISVLASTGLSSAGLAIVYASVYAAREMFGLINEPVAMMLLVGVTAGGIGLGVIGRRLFLAILSVVGAYLAPVLLAGSAPSPVFFPTYLSALLVLGLVLGGWIGGKFRVLRSLTWWGTMALGTVWIVVWAMGSGQINGLVFVGVVWALTHAELVVSARFFPDARDTERAPVPWAHARWLMSSFGATVWALAFGVALFRSISLRFDELAPAVLAVGMAIVTLCSVSNPVAALRGPKSARGQLAMVMIAQLGAMVIAVIALGLTGWSQAMAWVALGAAAAVAGSRIGVRGVFHYGVIVVAIGASRVAILDWAPWLVEFGDTQPIWARAWDVELGPVWAQLLGAAVAWMVCAACARPRHPVTTILSVIGVAFAMASFVSPHVGPGGLAVAWAVVGAGAMVASRFLRMPTLAGIGVVPIILGCGSWVIAFANPEIWTMSAAPVLLSAGMTRAVVIGACGALGAVMAWRHAQAQVAVRVMGAAVGLMLFAATSLEVHRMAGIWASGDPTARRAAVSMWWAIVGVGAVGFGTVMRRPWSRWVGLSLLAGAAAKLVLFDLSEISMEWRVVGSMVIGLILLGVAVGYARAIRRERDSEAAAAETDQT